MGCLENMNKLFLSCAFLLSLCLLGGCGKDNDEEPEGGNGTSEVEGSYVVDGKIVNLKYAYKMKADSGTIFLFYDRNVLNYAGSYGEPNIQYSCLEIFCDRYNEVNLVGIVHETNPYKGTGITYVSDFGSNDFEDYGTFVINKDKVKCSASSLPMIGYEDDGEIYIGKFNASFSVEGSPLDITGLIEDDDYSTRSIETIQVSDGNHIGIPKSLIPNYHQFFK